MKKLTFIVASVLLFSTAAFAQNSNTKQAPIQHGTDPLPPTKNTKTHAITPTDKNAPNKSVRENTKTTASNSDRAINSTRATKDVRPADNTKKVKAEDNHVKPTRK